MVKIVITDNFRGDYPYEKFVENLPRPTAAHAKVIDIGIILGTVRELEVLTESGTRTRFRRGQRLYHRKTGGLYVLSGFPVREEDSRQGFSYLSASGLQEFWRPVSELLDDRFLLWDGVSRLPDPVPGFVPAVAPVLASVRVILAEEDQ